MNQDYKWKGSTFISIFKKGDARSCHNYRAISLITNTSKILLTIIHKRMENTIERELTDNPAGFRKARRTRHHIANMRWIMGRQLEYGKQVKVMHLIASIMTCCEKRYSRWEYRHL